MRDKTAGNRPLGKNHRLQRSHSRAAQTHGFHALIGQADTWTAARKDFAPISYCGPRETLGGIAFRIIT